MLFDGWPMRPTRMVIAAMRIDPTAGTVEVRTYSPAADRYKADPANQFTISDFR